MTSANKETWNRAARLLFACVILACAAAQAMAQNAGPTLPIPAQAGMSRDDQQALGKQAAAQIEQQLPMLNDSSPEAQYVQQLGQKLAGTIPAEVTWPFEFHVLAQKDMNAIALPGGPIFISVGTIRSAANEAVIAGIMAHEMAHIYMQHSARLAVKAKAASAQAGDASASAGQAGAADAGGLAGQLKLMGIQIGAQNATVNYSFGDELQADYLATMILYVAGYNPQGIAAFFETLESQGGGVAAGLLNGHPNSSDRRQAIYDEMGPWPAKEFSGDTEEFEQARMHAMGVKAYGVQEIAQQAPAVQPTPVSQSAGAPPDQGNGTAPATVVAVSAPSSAGAPPPAAPAASAPPSAEPPPATVPAASAPAGGASGGGPSIESVVPSQNMIEADLGLMKMYRPDNWSVKMPQKQGQFIIVAPAAGMVGDNVGYGMLVGGFSAQQVQGMNVDQVNQSLIQQMEKTNGLTPMGDVKTTTISGHDGRSTMFKSSSPFLGADGSALPERDWLVTVSQSDGGVVFMVFVAPEANFNRLGLSYNAMLQSSEIK